MLVGIVPGARQRRIPHASRRAKRRATGRGRGGQATLPVNWDLFTSLVLSLMNTPPFQNFMAMLDGNGRASAVFNTYGPVAGMAGFTISFAYALNGPWDYASNGANIEIVP